MTTPTRAESAPDLLEAICKVIEGFECGVFVRSIANDHEPNWAIRALPYLLALAKLKATSDAERKETK